jgi:hypothetical protein
MVGYERFFLKNKKIIVSILMLGSLASGAAQANLITNVSFESTNVIVDLWLNDEKKGSFFNTQSLTSAGSDWETKSFDFLATSAMTKIGFTSSLSTDSSHLGVGLDNIRVEQEQVTAIPEQKIYVMLLIGLCILGFMSRRIQA